MLFFDCIGYEVQCLYSVEMSVSFMHFSFIDCVFLLFYYYLLSTSTFLRISTLYLHLNVFFSFSSSSWNYELLFFEANAVKLLRQIIILYSVWVRLCRLFLSHLCGGTKQVRCVISESTATLTAPILCLFRHTRPVTWGGTNGKFGLGLGECGSPTVT